MSLKVGLLFFSAVSGFVSVALGAFAAHALKVRLDEYSMAIWKTANEYQVVHTLVLLFLVLLLNQYDHSSLLKWSGLSFILGILIFSGSLYLLALFQIKWLGAITPIGGLLLLVGWCVLAIFTIREFV